MVNTAYLYAITRRYIKSYSRLRNCYASFSNTTEAATMAKPLPTDLPYHAFESSDEFEAFLAGQSETLPAFYLKLAKKSSGISSITADEAIEVGLCHGWIDGWGRSIDDDWYMKRFTPRRPKSIWSQKNVTTVAKLIEAGRMRPAGLAAVEAAKKDGRWARAYGGQSMNDVPDDFAALLKSNKAALEFFEGLKRSDRYSVLWRIQTASPTARSNRVEAMFNLMTSMKVPGQQGATQGAVGDRKPRDDSAAKDTNPKPSRTKRKKSLEAPVQTNARKSKRLAAS